MANSPLGTAPDQIAQTGTAQFPGVHGSLVLTDNASHIDVYLTSPNPAAEAKLSSLAPAGDVTFLHASHTRQAVLAVHRKALTQADTLRAQGIDIVYLFPGRNGDGLEHIGVVNATPAQVSTLDQLFGAANISVDNLAPSEAPVATGRDSDSPPWNGGDNETSNSTGCTTGVGITWYGSQYMITASHCYGLSWGVHADSQGPAGRSWATWTPLTGTTGAMTPNSSACTQAI
jgi:hypothetical protein